MSKNRFLFAFVAFLFMFPKGSEAQTAQRREDTAANVRNLDEIVIHDDRLQIPFSRENRDVVVIDRQQIQMMPVQSVSELLAYTAGVDIRQRSPWGGQADVSINGGTFDQTLVLLNGVKIIDPQTGHNMMNLPVSPDEIERIEILKGPAASAYGVNALSGAINIITQQPENSETHIKMTTGSSFENDENGKLYGMAGVNASAGLVTKRVQNFVALGAQQSSGYRYNTGLKNYKLFYSGGVKLKDQNKLSLMAGYVYNDFGANGFYAAPGDKESKEAVQTGLASIKGDFRVSDRWMFRPLISYRYSHDDYVYTRFDPGLYENLHNTNTLDATLNNTVSLRTGTLGFGLEYRGEWIASNSLGKHNRDNMGLYVEYGVSVLQNLSVHAGGYLNYSPYFGWQLLPSLDAGYPLNDHWRLFANFGTGIRVPTYTDWFYAGPENIGNDQLVTERAWNTEGGVRFSNGGLSGSANYFFRRVSHFIDWIKSDLNDPWQPQNFQEMDVPGVSATVDYHFPQIAEGKRTRWVAHAAYTYLNPKIRSDKETNIGYSHYALENLKNQAIAGLRMVDSHRLSIDVQTRYEERVNYKKYLLSDVKIEKSFGSFTVEAVVNNATNVTYVEAGATPLPGRWFTVGVKFSR